MIVSRAKMKYLGGFLVSLVLAIGFLAQPAQAQQDPPTGTPDAHCSGPVTYGGGFPTFAQTFTTSNTGDLTSAQIEVLKLGGSDDLTVSIQSVDPSTGAPTGTDLASTTVPGGSIPDGFSTVTANFGPASTASVVSGQQYALVVTSPGLHSVNIGIGETTPSSCSGKEYFSSAGPGGPFTVLFADQDIVFTVFVTKAPPPPPPVARPDVYKVNEDELLTVPKPGVLKNDTGTSPLTAKLVAKPRHGTLQLNANGSFSYKPNENFHGIDTFTYRASHGTSASNIAKVTIKVSAVDDHKQHNHHKKHNNGKDGRGGGGGGIGQNSG